MSTDDVKNYKLQARLPVAPKSPLRTQSSSTIRVAKRTVPRTDGTADRAAMRPPSVGKLIERRKADPETGEVRVLQRFKQTNFLGKGGFAKVYTVIEQDTQEIYAAKVIAKSSLQKKRTKDKLASEIRIHSMLKHKHIVKYVMFFEDSTSCYILMELCNNKSLADLIKARRRLTEPEVRFYMMQLLEAVSYMHSKRVIHRDLKLGNIFLNDDLHIKIGDFGLATRLQHENDRRRTLCGTPNYIAPEILERGDNGHSYEADIWSAGVILYTLLIGKPPFETNCVQATYKRIKENDYAFPEGVEISHSAKSLIRKILTSIPEERPTLQEIMSDEFFNSYIPHSLPVSALSTIPTFSSSRMAQDASGAPRLPLNDRTNTLTSTVPGGKEKKKVEDVIAEAKAQIALATKPMSAHPLPIARAVATHIVTSPAGDIADIFDTKKAKHAAQPEEFGIENREPGALPTTDAMVADSMGTRKRLRSPFRNASIADKSPTKQRARRSHLNPMSTCKRLIDDFEGKEEEKKDVKPSSSGPAKRISTQALVAVETDKPSRQAENDDEDNNTNTNTNKKNQRCEQNEENDMDEEDEEADERVTIRVHRTLTESFARLTMADRTEATLDGVSRAPATLASITHLNAFDDIKNGLVYGEGENSNVCWVRKWFDISDRYGLAYQLQDGSIGGYFNDRTSIMRRCVEPDTGSGWKMENEFVYMSYKSTRRGKRQHTERYSMDKFPQELYKKVQLLKYFQKLFDKENKSTSTLVDLAPEEYERTRSARSSVLHVDRWFRRKHASFFRLSNRIVQVNFTDESKVILSSDGKMVTYVDKQGEVHVQTLEAIVLNPNPSIINRLKYTRDILGDLLRTKESRSSSSNDF